MCYIVLKSNSLHWCSIKIALFEYFRKSYTLEGHSNIEVEEKRADGQENWLTRKRRRRMPWNHATVLCLSSTNHIWVRVHEPYSDWLIPL